MSIVSLLFEIGRQMLDFLNNKKMSVDIIYKLFMVDNQNSQNKNFNNFGKDRIKLNPEKINNSFKLTEKNNIYMETAESIKEENENKTEKILRQIHVFNIIKSFFCNGKKDKLISLCHEIITKDMCVEIILEKFYNLSRIYNSILEQEKNNLGLNKEPRFREINSIINSIHGKEKKNNKEDKT